MYLRILRRNWNHLARTDPLWAVLTDPTKRNGNWGTEEFFATGVTAVDVLLREVETLHPGLRRAAALDFGCGVGRLTQALASHFDRVCGVDVSEEMLALAQEHNRHGARVQYLHNARSDLRSLGDGQFDLVCSLLTLQHMAPSLARGYLAEFVRLCRPGGIVYFQLMAHPPPDPTLRRFSWWPPTLWKRFRRRFRKWLPDFLKNFGFDREMEMHGIPPEEVRAVLAAAGAEVLAVRRQNDAGPEIASYSYVVRKPAG